MLLKKGFMRWAECVHTCRESPDLGQKRGPAVLLIRPSCDATIDTYMERDANLHTRAYALYQVEGGPVRDVVVRKLGSILQLIQKGELLLAGQDTRLLLNIVPHTLDRVVPFHVQCDDLALLSGVKGDIM